MTPSAEITLVETRLRQFFAAETPAPWPGPPAVSRSELVAARGPRVRRPVFALAACLAVFVGSVVLSARLEPWSDVGRTRGHEPAPLGPMRAAHPAPKPVPARAAPDRPGPIAP